MEQRMPNAETAWDEPGTEDRPGPPPQVNQVHVQAHCVAGWHNLACPEDGSNWIANLCSVPSGQTQCVCTHTS